jgi:hypothetical protein
MGLVIILDVVLPFQSCQLFFATRKFGLRSSRVLLRWHMIQYNDVSFLHVEPVQVVQRVLRLWIGKLMMRSRRMRG